MSFFRYPGGKSKLRDVIVRKLLAVPGCTEYREPFFGGGCVGIKVLSDCPWFSSVHINDRDPGIYCLWATLLDNPRLLVDRINRFTPSVDQFDLFKHELTTCCPDTNDVNCIADYGFMKLAIHQLSYSGLGTKSGGPLGGREQKSRYHIGCRWSPRSMISKINAIHSILSGRDVVCSNADFASVIDAPGDRVLMYLDPPYFVKGNDLYQHGFTESDHQRLARSLKETEHGWVLSYDDCEFIRDLYSWADIQNTKEVSYSITATLDSQTGSRASRTKSELLISPAKGLRCVYPS
jgi:DNA adenine methylase